MIIVDFSQVVISHLMAEISGAKDVQINVPLLRHMVLNALRSFKVKFGSEYGQLVIAADSRKNWRRDAFQYYKANRKKSREDSDLNWTEIFDALSTIKLEIKEFFPYPVVEVDGAEADDVIAALAEWTQTNDLSGGGVLNEPEPQQVLILSGDGDFEQLQRYRNVRQYSPIQKKWIVAKGTPDEVVMEHILSGDKGDGVPNFLSPDNVFVTEGARQKSLMQAKLAVWKTQKPEQIVGKDKELMKNFKRNELLIDLRLTPPKIKKSIITAYISQTGKPRDRNKILNFFIKNKMKQMIEHTGEF